MHEPGRWAARVMPSTVTPVPVGRIVGIPSPRFFTLALLEAAASPTGSWEAWGALLASDPGLAVRLLREANGPSRRLRVEVLDLFHAATVLGVARVRRLFLTTPLEAGTLPLRTWQHALARSEAAARLAPAAGCDRGAARTAGLLAETGSIVLSLAAPAAFRRALRAAAGKPADAWPAIARRVLGTAPEAAAREAGERWGLPPRFRRALGAPVDSSDGLVALLHTAEIVAWKAGFPARRASAPPEPTATARRWLEPHSAASVRALRRRVLEVTAALHRPDAGTSRETGILGTAYGRLAEVASDSEEASRRMRTLNAALQNVQRRLGERDPADALLCEVVATLGFDRAILLEAAEPGAWRLARVVTASGKDAAWARAAGVIRFEVPARSMRARREEAPPELRALLDAFGAPCAVLASLAPGGRAWGLILADRAETGGEIDAEDESLLARLARETGVLLENWRLVQTVRSLAVTDALTGLSNRRSIMETLEVEVERARRTRRPLAVAMFDLDHFKAVNDSLGHATGDALLTSFAQLLREGLRRGDHVGRYGGEEFLGVLPGADLDRARVVAERIREATEAYGREHATRFRGHQIRVSVGIAALLGEEETSAVLLRRADGALYRAKSEGRNRVVAAPGRGPIASSLP